MAIERKCKRAHAYGGKLLITNNKTLYPRLYFYGFLSYRMRVWFISMEMYRNHWRFLFKIRRFFWRSLVFKILFITSKGIFAAGELNEIAQSDATVGPKWMRSTHLFISRNSGREDTNYFQITDIHVGNIAHSAMPSPSPPVAVNVFIRALQVIYFFFILSSFSVLWPACCSNSFVLLCLFFISAWCA